MIIDANVIFGFDRLHNRKMDGKSILNMMDDHKIEKAIITCNECMYYDFIEGNNKTSILVSQHPDRFIGFFSFHTARYFKVFDEVSRAVNELGLQGMRIFFTEISFGRGWSSGLHSLMLCEVLKNVNELKLPVFIEPGFSFADISTLVQHYPQINFIASGIGYANMAEAIIAVQKNQNLYLELSTSDAGDGIETLVNIIGADRLIFGTGMPFITPSVALTGIEYANISSYDKQKILHGNISAIMAKEDVKK